MNLITRTLLSTIGPLVIENLLEQIINEEKLTSFRDNLVSFFRKTADKTVNEVDDYLVEIAIETIMEPGKHIEQTRELCKMLREYAEHSKTKIDDMLVIPILKSIENLGTTPVKE